MTKTIELTVKGPFFAWSATAAVASTDPARKRQAGHGARRGLRLDSLRGRRGLQPQPGSAWPAT